MSPDSVTYLIVSLAKSYEARTGDQVTRVYLGAVEWAAFMQWWYRNPGAVRSDPEGEARLGHLTVFQGQTEQGIALVV